MKEPVLTAPNSVDTDVAAGRRVITDEASALDALAHSLGADFKAAVDLIAGTAGRVVITGMGKSGHIGRKIAATMASTGTPALYVHPGEASHGDLGMITTHDVVICLSNSGETAEIFDIVNYARRFAIPVIAVVGKGGSSLAKAANVCLLLPERGEACPMGLSPTTSTTMSLALGDALAIALLERRGFGAENYHVFHPGGKLGSRLIKVSDIMHQGDKVPLVELETPMSEALLVMTANSFGCVGVTDGGGALIGIVTDGDLRRMMSPDLLTKTAGDVMKRDPKTIPSGALAVEAVQRMYADKITRLFVVDDDQIVGFINVQDCLHAGVT